MSNFMEEHPNRPDPNQEIKTTVMGPPAFGSPDPNTAAAALLPVVDHPNRASLSEDYGADVLPDSNLESTRGTSEINEEEMTLEDLKSEAKARDLPVSGTKAELADRIREYDEAQESLDEGEDDDQ